MPRASDESDIHQSTEEIPDLLCGFAARSIPNVVVADMSGLRQPYLIVYNSASAAGWAYVTGRLVLAALTRGLPAAWEVAGWPLKIVQTCAILEIAHVALGLVRSPVATTTVQVFSRLFVVWCVLHAVPHVAGRALALPALPLPLSTLTLLLAWGPTEVIRYAYYASREAAGDAPWALTWLRYSTFLVLYPLGVASEVALLWMALPHIKATRPYSVTMPNRFNFAFDSYFLALFVLAAYLPGFYSLYTYMLSQRKRILGRGAQVASGKPHST